MVILLDNVIASRAFMESQPLVFGSYLGIPWRGRLLFALTIGIEVPESLDNLCLTSEALSNNENFFRWIHSINFLLFSIYLIE